MNSEPCQVCVVDDDPLMCSWLKWVLSSVGYPVNVFPSADKYLTHATSDSAHCLVVDLLLPGMTGLSLCQQIKARKSICSFLVITGNGDVSSAVEAMRLGASDFLEKPFTRERLIDSVYQAIQKFTSQFHDEIEAREFAQRLNTLTPREREVFDAVAAGHPTKVIAARWRISTRTVDVHRSRIMQKIGLESPMQLAHFIAVTLRTNNNNGTSAIA